MNTLKLSSSNSRVCPIVMKYISCAVLFLCSFLCAFGQENWDPVNATYTNHIYDFHWNLPSEISWVKVAPQESHTVFKAYTEMGIVVIVNLRSYTDPGYEFDLWDIYENFKEQDLITFKETAELMGAKANVLTYTKCRFAGSNAIKAVVNTVLNDDVKSYTRYSIKYDFLKNGFLWQVSLECMSDVYKKYGEDGLKQVFAGFGLNAGAIR